MSKTIIQEPKHEQRQIADGQSSVFMNEDFLFVSQMGVDDNDWANFHQPYLMGQSRMVRVLSGGARYVINLEEHTFCMGDVVILPKGGIIQVEEATEDYRISVVSLSDQMRQGVNQLLHIRPGDEELRLISDYFSLIDESLHTTDYLPTVMESLVASLYRLARHIRQKQESLPGHQEDRRMETFHRFLTLVNANADTERNIEFYARELCLAPRYLCRVIKETSGETIMHWVQKSVIDRAKIALRYSDHSIADIGLSLHFDDPSTFTRYFRSGTGTTPGEYRRDFQ